MPVKIKKSQPYLVISQTLNKSAQAQGGRIMSTK